MGTFWVAVGSPLTEKLIWSSVPRLVPRGLIMYLIYCLISTVFRVKFGYLHHGRCDWAVYKLTKPGCFVKNIQPATKRKSVALTRLWLVWCLCLICFCPQAEYSFKLPRGNIVPAAKRQRVAPKGHPAMSKAHKVSSRSRVFFQVVSWKSFSSQQSAKGSPPRCLRTIARHVTEELHERVAGPLRWTGKPIHRRGYFALPAEAEYLINSDRTSLEPGIQKYASESHFERIFRSLAPVDSCNKRLPSGRYWSRRPTRRHKPPDCNAAPLGKPSGPLDHPNCVQILGIPSFPFPHRSHCFA